MGDDLMRTAAVDQAGSLPADVAVSCSNGWRLVTAQKRGSHHEAAGTNCEDSYRTATLSPDVLLIAVADGAGSVRYPDLGSNTVSQHSLDHLCSRIGETQAVPTVASAEGMLLEAMAAALEAAQTEAAALGVTVRELSSTLILIIARRDFVAVAQVGDGATIIADEQGKITALTTPKTGEYINEITFLTSSEAVEKAQIKVWQGRASGLAAFSDGLQMLCLKWPEYLPHEPFFTPLFRFVATASDDTQIASEIAQFLSSTRIRELTDDDLTLVLASTRDTANES
jgi:serine/threonine protein phosphatase PrpC